MSSNTNNLFWIITGAVIVIGIFLLVSNSNNHAIKNIFDNMDNYFGNRIGNGDNNDEEEPEPINYEQYIPNGWNLVDVVMTKGVVYVVGNFRSIGGGGYTWDVRIINANDYEVHFINGKVSFIDSQTNNPILHSNLPFDRILAPNGGFINSFTSAGVPIGLIDHYILFGWGD